MHVPTHIMSGWCAANLLPLTARQRMLSMIAATAVDFDGLGRFVSQELYWDWHHKLGHNLLACILIAGLLAMVPQPRRVLAFVVYLALAHLHLVLDYFGSGPGWPIYYLWPFSNLRIINPNAWDLYSWQNITVGYGLLAWVLWIAWRQKRTPLEVIMPSLDRQLVGLLPKRHVHTEVMP